MTEPTVKPKLTISKFSSCDGCQLSLLSCEDDLLDLVGQVDIAYSSRHREPRSRDRTTCRWWKDRSPPSRTPSASTGFGEFRGGL